MVPFLEFRCLQFSKYLLQPSSKVSNAPLDILIFCIAKSSLKIKKYWTHHERKYVYDVSKLYLLNFTSSKRTESLKKPYAARITCLPLR